MCISQHEKNVEPYQNSNPGLFVNGVNVQLIELPVTYTPSTLNCDLSEMCHV